MIFIEPEYLSWILVRMRFEAGCASHPRFWGHAPSTQSTKKLSFPQILRVDVTKTVPHKALKLIASG